MPQGFDIERSSTLEGGLVLRAGRAFGEAEASELRIHLRELGNSVPVRLDFARTVTLSEHALAMLIEWVLDQHLSQVVFRGLNRHHRRLLRYLVPRLANALQPALEA